MIAILTAIIASIAIIAIANEATEDVAAPETGRQADRLYSCIIAIIAIITIIAITAIIATIAIIAIIATIATVATVAVVAGSPDSERPSGIEVRRRSASTTAALPGRARAAKGAEYYTILYHNISYYTILTYMTSTMI